MNKTLLTALLLTFFKVAAAQPCIQNTNSLNFGGSSYVSFSSNNNLAITGSITVEAWIYPTAWAFNSANGTIVCHHSWTMGSEVGYVLRAGGTGQLSFNIGGVDAQGANASWQEAVSGINALTLNTWTHVAGTFDGSNVRIFVNGIQVGSTAFTGTIAPATAFPMAIGRLSDNGVAASRYWSGRIDEVRVWNRALIAAELQANRNTHIDPTQQTGLAGYWRFNEGTGTTVNDLSGNGNNGTMVGATFVTPVPFNQSAATPIIIPSGNTLTSTLATTYQWNLNGSPIPNATGQVWQAVQNGTYTVTVTDSLGCSATSGPYFITTIGVSELSDGSKLTVQQNSTTIYVSLTGNGGIENIRLIDLNGRVVYETSTQGESSHEISTNGMNKGIYIVDVTGKNAKGRSKIMIR